MAQHKNFIIIMIYYASWQHKLKKTYIHKTTAGNDYTKANTHIHMQSHRTINIPQNYSTQQTYCSCY